MMNRSLILAALLTACATDGAPLSDANAERVTGRTYEPTADHVEAVDCSPGHNPRVFAQGSVRADGSFSIRVPARSTRFVLRVVTSAGAELESTLVDWSGMAAGSVIAAGELSEETSVEAAVWLAAQAQATGHDVSTVDVRAWIDAELAAAVTSCNDEADAVAGLGLSVLAASETEAQAWAQAGVHASAEAWFRARAQAMASVNAAAAAGADAATLATLRAEAMIAAAASLRGHAEDCATTWADAAFAFETTAQATITDTTVIDAALHASASAHAHVVAAATLEVLAAAHVGQGAMQDGSYACDQLIADIEAAADVAARADAWADFEASLVGDARHSVLGGCTNLSLAAELLINVALSTCSTADAALDASLEASAAVFIAAGDNIDIHALAATAVDASADLDATLSASFGLLLGVSAQDADLSSALVSCASAD